MGVSNLSSLGYEGYIKIEPTEEEFDQLYSKHHLKNYLLHENEYVFTVDSDDNITDCFCYQDGKLRGAKYVTVNNSFVGTVKPRNPYQRIAMDMLSDPISKVKVVRGVYGSGKDFIMLSQALELVQKGYFDKIVFIRPNITVKGLPDIGALPGTADEKLSWTLGPFFDKVGGQEGVDMLIHNNTLEVVPLLHVRGRSFEKSIVYVTEGQNMTTEIAKLILGRIGEGSELWINGDTHQTDKKMFEDDNGLVTMINKLKGNKLFSYVYLPITERSAVANLANLLDE